MTTNLKLPWHLSTLAFTLYATSLDFTIFLSFCALSSPLQCPIWLRPDL